MLQPLPTPRLYIHLGGPRLRFLSQSPRVLPKTPCWTFPCGQEGAQGTKLTWCCYTQQWASSQWAESVKPRAQW